MGHNITIEVPEEMYEPLAETAKKKGQSPEELAVEWLISAIHHAMRDPVEKFIGAFPSNVSDWPDEHDKHIGKSLKNSSK